MKALTAFVQDKADRQLRGHLHNAMPQWTALADQGERLANYRAMSPPTPPEIMYLEYPLDSVILGMLDRNGWVMEEESDQPGWAKYSRPPGPPRPASARSPR